jgi:alkylhydroperoxidase family enzyme
VKITNTRLTLRALVRRVFLFFSAGQVSDLTFAISLMNAFNRLAIAMRMSFPGNLFPSPAGLIGGG